MKRIIKRARALNYEVDYTVSFALINWIANETREPYQAEHDEVRPCSPDSVLETLINGETVVVYNPFGSRVEYTLEDSP